MAEFSFPKPRLITAPTICKFPSTGTSCQLSPAPMMVLAAWIKLPNNSPRRFSRNPR